MSTYILTYLSLLQKLQICVANLCQASSAPNWCFQRQTSAFSAKLSASAPNFQFQRQTFTFSAKLWVQRQTFDSQRQTSVSAPNFFFSAKLPDFCEATNPLISVGRRLIRGLSAKWTYERVAEGLQPGYKSINPLTSTPPTLVQIRLPAHASASAPLSARPWVF